MSATPLSNAKGCHPQRKASRVGFEAMRATGCRVRRLSTSPGPEPSDTSPRTGAGETPRIELHRRGDDEAEAVFRTPLQGRTDRADQRGLADAPWPGEADAAPGHVVQELVQLLSGFGGNRVARVLHLGQSLLLDEGQGRSIFVRATGVDEGPERRLHSGFNPNRIELDAGTLRFYLRGPHRAERSVPPATKPARRPFADEEVERERDNQSESED